MEIMGLLQNRRYRWRCKGDTWLVAADNSPRQLAIRWALLLHDVAQKAVSPPASAGLISKKVSPLICWSRSRKRRYGEVILCRLVRSNSLCAKSSMTGQAYALQPMLVSKVAAHIVALVAQRGGNGRILKRTAK